MLNLTSNSIVYVICPAYLKTGGAELAHQLVYMINKFGGNALITYYDRLKRPIQITEAYKNYVTNFVNLSDVIDLPENILISPENNPEKMSSFFRIQKCIWWMSVDNYLFYHSAFFLLKKYGLRTFLKTIKNGTFHFFKQEINNSMFHFYQSEYAREFLQNKGVTHFCRLSDYLNLSYFDLNLNTIRKDVVLYNPSKGFEFTKKIMEKTPDIKWIPLQNMTTEQVKETLLHSKVYIDFGNHPGKDRFPREAAMCGCCVITGKRGSAKFFEDVPIADEFKFDESRKTIPMIISKIRNCLDNYESESPKFNGYRNFIKSEYQTFQDDVKKIFTSFK